MGQFISAWSGSRLKQKNGSDSCSDFYEKQKIFVPQQVHQALMFPAIRADISPSHTGLTNREDGPPIGGILILSQIYSDQLPYPLCFYSQE